MKIIGTKKKYLPTKPIAPLAGRPLWKHDMLMEIVQFEDRILHEHYANSALPPQKPLPKLEWHEAAWYVFGRGVYYVNCLRKI